jgi:glucuronate isomerase
MPFIHDDFLLSTKTAQRLYHQFAEEQPIFDYHCHLSPGDIAHNRQFKNLFEIWLEGDHYKWRAMRTNGVAEKFCTGDASPYDKFLAWAKTVPQTLRNPLYHWTHLELKRYFGISELLDEKSAKKIWDKANEQLAKPALTTHGILKKFNVKVVCTTDDPADALSEHREFARSGHPAKMLPAFRPDNALTVNSPAHFNRWIEKLAAASNIDINSYGAFTTALTKRHDFFHSQGCRLSDHGMSQCFADFCSEKVAAGIFDKARRGEPASPEEHAQFASNMMLLFGHLDAKRQWVKQLHLGALRNNNTRLLKRLGADTGFDSIGDWPQAKTLAAYLDKLEAPGGFWIKKKPWNGR